MRTDQNGLPYYMNHQVWRPLPNDPRGIGGDQFAMLLSSWQLLYQYTGDESVRENMKFIADYYLTHSLSPKDALWPNIPFPYNTLVYSGVFDGDMTEGKGVTQPDKAGSFGYELVQLHYTTSRKQWQPIYSNRYLDYAMEIANTLAAKTQIGDNDNSPLPFKVNAITGEVANLKNSWTDATVISGKSSYTTNWVGTLRLFEELIKLNIGNVSEYQKAHATILKWMKEFPLKTNKWGPFFEDIEGWSDTQINAITFAKYMMENPTFFPNWKTEVQVIFEWTYKTMGNKQWEKYGVIVMNEQTAYQTPGNSHSSRQAAAELQYAALSGDNSRTENAIRVLNWATYMVDFDGKNNYPRDEVWLTDGYGDYVRHYLRAMAYKPELAPTDEVHILHSSHPLILVSYNGNFNKTLGEDVPYKDLEKVILYYHCIAKEATQIIKLPKKPTKVLIGKNEIREFQTHDNEGFTWTKGVLRIKHSSSGIVTIFR
ncbi:hypothetical protein [Lacihabitans sp. CS3-21]|uniref:hypothetical protein n=1 Tax=Lacihabitans sp. CS3-21 TaxID=2487332 RepID=UPI0020CD8B56|nr:hypothetical protein [Lacihabitans sp. CS3-21]